MAQLRQLNLQLPSWVRARWAKISKIRPVRSKHDTRTNAPGYALAPGSGHGKKNDRSTRRFDSFRNFNCFTSPTKYFGCGALRLPVITCNVRHRRKRPEIQTPGGLPYLCLRKIDVYQYRLLTSIITVKQRITL